MAGFKVPVSQRAVALQPLPAARRQVSPDPGAFGALEADVIGQIGGQVEKLGETALAVEAKEEALAAKIKAKELKQQAEFKKQKDKTYAQDAIINYQDWWRTQEPSYTTKTGLDADGVTNVANEDIEKKRKEIHKDLKNEEQKRFFDAKFASERDNNLNVVVGHEVSQFVATKEQQTNSVINNSTRDAAAAVGKIYEEGTIFSKSLDLEDAITEKTKGLPKEAAKQVSAEVWSAFHEGILNRKVALNATDAQEYYDKHKKEIVPENREGIENTLKTEDTLQFAQENADRIAIIEPDRTKWDDVARDMEYPGTPAEQAEKRKALLGELKTFKDTLDQEDIENKKKTLINALKAVDASADKREGDAIADRQQDPENSAKARAYSKAKFDIKTQNIVTDRKVQAEIYEGIDKGIIDSVDDLLEFAPDLSPGDYKTMITEIRNKKNPDMKTPSANYNIAKNALESTTGEPYSVEDHSKMFMFVLDKLDKEAQALGRSPTLDEAIKLTSKYIVDGEAAGEGFWGIGGYDPDMSLLEAAENDSLDVWIPDINENDVDEGQERRTIAGAFTKSLGFVIDNEVLFRLYKKEEIIGEELSPQQNKLYRQELEKEIRKRNR